MCVHDPEIPGVPNSREDMCMKWQTVKEIAVYSSLTCAQQSVMNFGILLVQGLVNSFGTAVMAAFAVAVKIDTIAYMPVQDFGNAFSTFVARTTGRKTGPHPHRHPLGGVLGGPLLPGHRRSGSACWRPGSWPPLWAGMPRR